MPLNFREIDSSYFTSFLAWTFSNFLILCLNFKNIIFLITTLDPCLLYIFSSKRYPFTIGVTTWLVKYKKEDLKTSTEIKKDWKEKVSYSMEKVKDEWAEKMKEKEEYEAKWKEFSEKFKKKKK